MKAFLIILVVTLLAFGDSFLAIAVSNRGGDGEFVSSFFGSFMYTYCLILGDFDTGDYDYNGQFLLYVFFLLCTLFNMIIMLNLLISIVSETFANVNAKANPNSYKEMASLIAENSYLIPNDVAHDYAVENMYLYVVTDADTEAIAENPFANMSLTLNE